MEQLADVCVELERHLREGNLRRARSWLAGAIDMVDAAIQVHDERKQALKQALRHIADTGSTNAPTIEATLEQDERPPPPKPAKRPPGRPKKVAAAAVPSEQAVAEEEQQPSVEGVEGGNTDDTVIDAPAQENLDVAPDASESDSDASGSDHDNAAEIADAPVTDAEDTVLGDVPAAADCDAAAAALDPAAADTFVAPELPHGPVSLGTLGSLILEATALNLGRNEDSIPYGVIADSVASARKAADEARVKAEQAEKVAQALATAEEQLRSRGPSAVRSEPSGAAAGTPGRPPAEAAPGETPARGAVDATPAAAVSETKRDSETKREKTQGKGSTTKKEKPDPAKGMRGLMSFGFAKKESTVKVQDDGLLIGQFTAGDRQAPKWLRDKWGQPDDAADEAAEASQQNQKNVAEGATKPSLKALLKRNELDVAGMGVPRTFDAEVCFVQWAHENYVNSEARPPFLGTWNSSLVTARLGRPDQPQRRDAPDEAFAVPRAADIVYDDDSGDDWDSEGEGSDIGADDERSQESELDSDELSFLAGDDDFSDDEEREENAIERSEMAELEARRNRKRVELLPRYDGVFDGIPLGRHPLSTADRLEYVHPNAARAVVEGSEFHRIATAVFEAAGIPMPEELMSEQERALAEAKRAKAEAAAARAAAGTTLRKVTRPRTRAAAKAAAASGEAAAAPAGTVTLEAALAAKPKAPAAVAAAAPPAAEGAAVSGETGRQAAVQATATAAAAAADGHAAAAPENTAKRSRSPAATATVPQDDASVQVAPQQPAAEPQQPQATGTAES